MRLLQQHRLNLHTALLSCWAQRLLQVIYDYWSSSSGSVGDNVQLKLTASSPLNAHTREYANTVRPCVCYAYACVQV
jgi:hypothetical protein